MLGYLSCNLDLDLGRFHRSQSMGGAPPSLSLRVSLCRALRRDDDSTREIGITISSWRVVQQKLVPLILECRDDSILVKTLLKIYVMLTMPLSKPAEEALAKPVNPKAQGDVRDQQARRRENALAQQVGFQGHMQVTKNNTAYSYSSQRLHCCGIPTGVKQ